MAFSADDFAAFPRLEKSVVLFVLPSDFSAICIVDCIGPDVSVAGRFCGCCGCFMSLRLSDTWIRCYQFVNRACCPRCYQILLGNSRHEGQENPGEIRDTKIKKIPILIETVAHLLAKIESTKTSEIRNEKITNTKIGKILLLFSATLLSLPLFTSKTCCGRSCGSGS